MSHFERLAKENEIGQPYIKDDIMDALIVVNNCHSYRALSKHINNWCSPFTIESWLRVHPTYILCLRQKYTTWINNSEPG
jgi:hypothetical protein